MRAALFFGLKNAMAKACARRPDAKPIAGVSRFEVIEQGKGRVLVRHGVSVELSFQDDGRTLKVFVDGS